MVIKEQSTTQSCSRLKSSWIGNTGEKERETWKIVQQKENKIKEITLFSRMDASLQCDIILRADRKTTDALLFAYTEILFQGRGCSKLPFCCTVKIKGFELCK